MANINDFKAKLAGGGARANQFKVTMPFPGYSQVGGEIEELAFLCKTTQLPAMTLGSFTVPFRGRQIKIAGDRTYADWTIQVLMDTNFKLRNAFERWSNGINNATDGEGLTNPADYQVDAFVDQLDRNGTPIKSYTLRGVYPIDVAAVELDYGTNDAISEFGVTFAYQYFESNTTT